MPILLGFYGLWHITAFIWTLWIVMYPVFLLVCAQSSPILWTEYISTAMLVGFIVWTVAMWLAIRSWPCILLDLLLYLCISAMLHVFPSYGCVIVEIASVSSGMTRGPVWYFCHGACPGVVVNFSFTFTLWHVAGSRVTFVAGFVVFSSAAIVVLVFLP